MVEELTAGDAVPLPRCMWCSAPLHSENETTCPSCGATLIEEGDRQVPGVTAIDAEAIVRGARLTKPRSRSRLMSWISGEYQEEEKPAPPGSLAPPPIEVRREMLRLELAAEVANLQAEVGAMAAEAAIESGEPIELTPGASDAGTAAAEDPAAPGAEPTA